jgi:hypothetical protein
MELGVGVRAVIVAGCIMGEKALRIIVASLLLYLSGVAARVFHRQEETIADINRAILSQ